MCFPGLPWWSSGLRHCAPTAEDKTLIPGWGTRKKKIYIYIIYIYIKIFIQWCTSIYIYINIYNVFIQWCTSKCLTFVGEGLIFSVYRFLGRSSLPLVSFRLPIWCHWVWNWAEIYIFGSCKPVQSLYVRAWVHTHEDGVIGWSSDLAAK